MNCITSVDRNTLVIDLAPFVQKVDTAIDLSGGQHIAFPNTCPLESDLSGG